VDRRTFFRTAGLQALALSSIAGTGCLKRPARRPNIVFILADDLGYGELGCYGQRKIRTPHLDRLARQGMRFTDGYTGAPVCAPARCNLLTGKHAGHAYIRDNHEIGTWESFEGQLPLPAGTATLAAMLKEQGYATGAFGKWGLGGVGSTGDPLNMGFDTFLGYNCQRHAHDLYPRYLIRDSAKLFLEGNPGGPTGSTYAPDIIADGMLDFIRANKDRPFFLYHPNPLPHLALQAPQEEIDRYKGLWPETPYTGTSYQPHPTPKACYAAMISILDRHVGSILALLEELGLDDNTLVVFTSDNGPTHVKDQVDYEFFESAGPLRGLKGSVYEGGIRVPLIARWPGRIKAGDASGVPVAHYDVPATLADLLGAEPPGGTDGLSFLPTLLGRPRRQARHEFLFWDFAGYGGQLAVRMGPWKGVKRDLKKNPDAPLELYDLDRDIAERDDLAARRPDIAARIEEIMLQAREVPEVERFRFGRYR
jgi:arylsulfatase A